MLSHCASLHNAVQCEKEKIVPELKNELFRLTYLDIKALSKLVCKEFGCSIFIS